MVNTAADEIFRLCSLCGFDILRYPDNLRAYLKKTLKNCDEAVDQCVKVLQTDGFVDGMMWCRYFTADPERQKKCEEDLLRAVRGSAGPHASELDRACRAILAAGTRSAARPGKPDLR